jgi:quercetin dioxygenase-like cupin family protein
MKINHGREPGTASERRSETFTGEVWADSVLSSTGHVMVNNVFFAPGARTNWHRHEAGQILYVTSGEGRVATRDGSTATIGVGDTVWFPPGEEHWHGAAPGSYVVHLAVSLDRTEWLEPVSDEDYDRSGS